MTPEKQAALVAKHADFLASHADSPTAAGGPGITCGDGWFGILDDLFTAMQPLLAETLHLSNPPRLYEIGTVNHRLPCFWPLTPEMASLIYRAVAQSAQVCERCGKEKPESAGGSSCSACDPL